MWLQEENVGQEVMIEDLTVSRCILVDIYFLLVLLALYKCWNSARKEPVHAQANL